ncbi:hypothetical protein OROMI_017621 [Orobanche minor]
MAMWELVSGGAACAVPGSTSPSNPLDALANALIGSSSKTQKKASKTEEELQEEVKVKMDAVRRLPMNKEDERISKIFKKIDSFQEEGYGEARSGS